MKYIIIIIVSFLLGFLVHKQFFSAKESEIDVSYMLQNSIKQVSKLVVTEAKYSQVYTQKNSDKYLFDLLSFDKQAIILGTVEANVYYNLEQLKYEIDPTRKKIYLVSLPKPEIEYNFDFKWYDMEQSKFNQFTKSELNQIQEKAKLESKNKINETELKNQSHKRFFIELNRLWAGLLALGWKVEDHSMYLNSNSKN